MGPLATGALYCLAIAMAYLLVRTVSALFRRSRCCGAKLRYTFGWNYKHDGDRCMRCGMLND